MNYTFDVLNKRYEVIGKFCEEYKNELTVMSGILAENYGLCNYDEYIKFVNSLTDEVFIGNYLTALMNDVCIDYYSQILDGKMTFVEFVERSTFSKSIANIYLEKIES